MKGNCVASPEAKAGRCERTTAPAIICDTNSRRVNRAVRIRFMISFSRCQTILVGLPQMRPDDPQN